MCNFEDIFRIKNINGMDVYIRKPDIPLTEKSKPLELEYIIKELTGEEFEGDEDERNIKNPDNFEILEEFVDDFGKNICLCSERKCEKLYIVKHIPKNIYLALGSSCYMKFHDKSITEFYYKFKADNCKSCEIPLIYKNRSLTRNTCKNNEGKCFECMNAFLRDTIKYSNKKIDDLNDIIHNLKKQIEDLEDNDDDTYINNLLDELKFYKNEYEKNKLNKENIYLNVPYNDKDNAKSLGAKWDVDKKSWYSFPTNKNLNKLKELYLS